MSEKVTGQQIYDSMLATSKSLSNVLPPSSEGFEAFQTAYTNNPGISNSFYAAMMRVAQSRTNNLSFEFPIMRFKSKSTNGLMEDIHYKLPVEKHYDPYGLHGSLTDVVPPQVQTSLTVPNRHSRYDISLNNEFITAGVDGWDGLTKAIRELSDTLIDQSRIDEYDYFRALLNEVYKKRAGKLIAVGELTESNAKSVYKNLGSIVRKAGFPARANLAGVLQNIPKIENLTIIMSIDTQLTFDLDILANSFNVNIAEINASILAVDEMPDPNILMMVVDNRGLYIKDIKNEMHSFSDPYTLMENNFLHVHQNINFNIFSNCWIFVKSLPEKFAGTGYMGQPYQVLGEFSRDGFINTPGVMLSPSVPLPPGYKIEYSYNSPAYDAGQVNITQDPETGTLDVSLNDSSVPGKDNVVTVTATLVDADGSPLDYDPIETFFTYHVSASYGVTWKPISTY